MTGVLRASPVAALSEAWVCGRSRAGITGSNTVGGLENLSVVNVVYCQVEVSATGQRSPTVCLCVSLSAFRCRIVFLHLQNYG